MGGAGDDSPRPRAVRRREEGCRGVDGDQPARPELLPGEVPHRLGHRLCLSGRGGNSRPVFFTIPEKAHAFRPRWVTCRAQAAHFPERKHKPRWRHPPCSGGVRIRPIQRMTRMPARIAVALAAIAAAGFAWNSTSIAQSTEPRTIEVVARRFAFE